MKTARLFLSLLVFLVFFFQSISPVYSENLTFGPNILVSDSPSAYDGSGDGPPILDVDVVGGVYAAWMDHREGRTDIYFSQLAPDGSSFSANKAITGINDPKWYPQIEVDGGNIYIAWRERRIVGNQIQEGIFFTRSTDGGQTFTEEVLIDVSDEVPISMIAHDNKIYIAHSKFLREIWLATSTDGGISFTKTRVSSEATSVYRQRPTVDFMGNNVYVAWRENSEVFFAKSPDGGANFVGHMSVFSHPDAVIYNPPGNYGRLQTRISQEGIIYLAFDFHLKTTLPFTGNMEIFFIKSTNGGSSFTAAQRLPDDLPTSFATQEAPSLTLLPDGSPAVAWRDVRPDGGGKVFLVYSQDQGETFSPNIRINNTVVDYVFAGPIIQADTEGKIHFLRRDASLPFRGVYYTKIDLGLQFDVPPTPFLDLPWDYKGKGLSFEQVAFDPFSWFDHQYPLQNIPCCVQRVMKYTGETENDFYRSHNGYDYASKNGVLLNTSVLAAASGWATYVPWQNSNGAGNIIKIDHENDYQTWYEHLSGDGLIINQEGQRVYVTKGQKIGEVGMTGNTTGPHIHLSVFKDRDGDGSFDDEIPLGATDPLGWGGELNQDPWPKDKGGASSFNLFTKRSQPQSETIPITGGFLDTDNVDINVPDGAPTEQFNLTFRHGPFESASNLIKSIMPSFFLEAVNTLGQKISQFSIPVEISYNYSNADLSNINEDTLQLYTFNEQTQQWDPSPTILDKINKIASGETLHFSQFALMGEIKDLVVPTTEVIVNGDEGQDNWYRSDVIVQLNGKDNDGGIGLQYTLYTLNSNDWLEYQEPIVFEQEGYYEITYQSYDQAENMEDRKTVSFSIDKTPPEVAAFPDRTPDYNGWYNHPVTISFSGVDTLSGILSCSDPTNYSDPEDINALVSGNCMDQAGNIGSTLFSFQYDATPPEVSIQASPNIIWPPNGKIVDVRIIGSAVDKYLGQTIFGVEDEYGLIEPQISHFDQTVQLEAQRNGSDLDGRLYIIKVVVDDLAGNTSEKQVEVMVTHDKRNKKE